MNYELYIAVLAAALAIHSMIDILMKAWPVKVRIIWFAVVVLLPVVGPLAYYIRRRALIETHSVT